MTSERTCPVCDKPVLPEKGIYRVGDTEYHRDCYEKRPASDRLEASERRAVADRLASEKRCGSRSDAPPPMEARPGDCTAR
jgi:hypothetical protein